MLFTPEQEQQLISDNMPKIYRAVDNFMARCSSDIVRVPYDDFVQEVCLAFLIYIRKCKTPDAVNKFPWYSAMNAMRNVVMAFQPMSCEKSTHRFSEIIHSMPSTMSLDSINASTGLDINGLSKHWVDDKDTQLDFDIFMDDQNDKTKRIASMRIYGMNNKQIADQFGVTKWAIRKHLDKLSNAYKKYSKEDDSDE